MIYIATHKEFQSPGFAGYVPLQVGAALHDDFGYLRDDTGDNISTKNPNFCELTGLYWIWKNTEDEYKGLVHYRRFFGKSNLSKDFKDVYTYDELVEMLSHCDMVVPYIEYFKENAKDEILMQCCTTGIFDELSNVLAELYPDYLVTYNEYFSQKKSILFNMLFCRNTIFDAYCEWLFDILFELERRVDLSSLDDYQKRLFGFLSERLLNVWILKNSISTKNCSIINSDNNKRDSLILLLRRWYHRINI